MDTADDIYQPEIYAQGPVSRDDEPSAGMKPEKHPVPTLRVFDSDIGHQWIMYGGHSGGTQDYAPPEAEHETPRCDWFTFLFEGILTIEGREVFGNWKMIVRGKSLESLCYYVSKHVMPTLRIGSNPKSLQPFSVATITFEPYQPAPQGR